MRLFLVQHGDALPKEEHPDRPLSRRGETDVQRLARVLAQAGVHPAHVFHSGKRRAEQTAVILAGAIDGDVAVLDCIDPKDDTGRLVRTISRWTEDTLVVGHQPFLGRLASRLLTGSETQCSLAFAPGSAICLERGPADEWSLCWMLRPDLL